MKEIICYIFLLPLFVSIDFSADNWKQNSLQDSLIAKIDSSNALTNNIKDTGLNTIKEKVYYGTASFYSRSLEGTKTSNDEVFRHNKLTAASNKFKLGTWLRVTNISNGKSIIVRVNDRMHPKMAKKGRIVDLSRLGAKKLDFVNKGITKVKVEVVPRDTKQ